MKFDIPIGGFSSEMKKPKLKNWVYFEQITVKKHPIWAKLGALLSKMVYWWVGNLARNWYRESQIFNARYAHPRMILGRVPPMGPKGLTYLVSEPSLVPIKRSFFFQRGKFYIFSWSWQCSCIIKPNCVKVDFNFLKEVIFFQFLPSYNLTSNDLWT